MVLLQDNISIVQKSTSIYGRDNVEGSETNPVSPSGSPDNTTNK
jgi:hypothetical protein